MRFKTLEIFGFKSFGHKTTIHFEPGVTAIVGPNGSGKSNIVDSIRWVLGEHNPRDVRAPRLEDCIFNGTDTRAPLSMAEVSLTIDNGQGLLPISFSEVAIMRRVYRSGESEYFINQAPCRLRDIQELFLGTGLGGGTYAIIEQGHIDMILSSKPEERRKPFEEASGVAKYLAKKQETMRRLDETEEHLVRIADIIAEVRRQVNALERAANKARQFKTQWEQLKSCEIRLAADELSGGQARHQQLQDELTALTSQRDALDAQKQSHMASLEAANAAVSAIQARLQDARTKVMEHASQIDQHRSQVGLKSRWIEELEQQLQRIEQEALQLRERIAQVEGDFARVSGGEGELQSQVSAVQAQLAQGHEELSGLEAAVQAAVDAMSSAKSQVFAAASEASHQRNELTQMIARVHTVEAQLTRLEEQRVQRAAQIEDAARQRAAAEAEQQGRRAGVDEAQRRIDAAQQALGAADGHRHELTGRLQQLREQLASERAKVKLLEDLWKRHEGFPETVKALIGRGIEGVVAPLADLVQPVAGYEDVVEAALGPLADALVVRDRQALDQCRGVLDQEQLEPCRFLVLSDCPAATVALEQPAVQAGVAGAVRQYVRAEEPYQRLVDWVLNDSWIIDDIERLLGNGGVPQGRVVSQRGDRWDRRSWRFGNSRAAAHSRLGRKQRWEHAQAYLQVVEQDVESVGAQAQAAEQAWQSALADTEAAKSELAQRSSALHRADAQLAQALQESQRLEAEDRAGRTETDELLGRRAEWQQSLATLEQSVRAAEERQRALEQTLTQAQADKDAADSRRQQLLIAKAQVEAMVSSLSDRLGALQTRRQEIESERARLAQQLDDKTRQRDEASARSQDLAAQVRQHEADTQRLTEERTRLEAEVEQVAQSLRDEEARRDQVLPHVLAAEQELSSLARRIQDATQQLSERTFRRERLLERLRELYQIDEATLQAEMQAGASALTDDQRAAMTEQVQKLRGKLDTMGPVSLGSVDEYDELKRRLDFLQTQQQDLTQAREDLKSSITQINRAARVQFKETFEKIKVEFQHYYTRLFNGGQADLILMDEEDVLECGIDIAARPPGKRLQSISLLSGGERALTAIALLFALFKVRPSPFCILDEIDAPLDEANVDRFTKVLEEFLVLSQFILITHNKKTITKADSLYGVTMPEAGISQILSAKLTQAPQPVHAA